jgi:hypothetical protein
MVFFLLATANIAHSEEEKPRVRSTQTSNAGSVRD